MLFCFEFVWSGLRFAVLGMYQEWVLGMSLCLLCVGMAYGQEGVEPYGVSSAFAGRNGDAMAVMWSTLDEAQDNTVTYGTSPDGLTLTVPTNTTQYYRSYQHVAHLPDLAPDTEYYYSVVSDGVTSGPHTFRTARKAGDAVPFTIAIYGDMGISQSKDTFLQLRKLDVDWFFHVGDISYADDHNTANPGAYESTWNTFQTVMQDVTSKQAYMVCPGNHEAACMLAGATGCPDELKNFTAYRNRFHMPYEESGSNTNMWYSFDYGMVHFVSISSETDYDKAPEGPRTLFRSGPFGDQIAWLQADLAAANLNRDVTPWIVVVAHRPLYSSALDDFPLRAKKNLRAAIEDILYENNVDAYFCGHVHAYERMYPVYDNNVDSNGYDNPRALTQIVIGNAGNIEGHSKFSKNQPDYVAYRNREDYGYGTLTFHNTTTMTFDMRRATDSFIVDSFSLFRQH